MSRVYQPYVRVWVCFLGVTPAVHTSTQLDGVRSMANPSHLLKVSQWPGNAAFAGTFPWGQASQGGMGSLGAQTPWPLLVSDEAVSFSRATAREVAWSCQGSCTCVQVQHGSCVRPSGDTRTSKLSVQAQMFLLPCTLDFMVHEKIVVLLDVSQVPVCLTDLVGLSRQ